MARVLRVLIGLAGAAAACAGCATEPTRATGPTPAGEPKPAAGVEPAPPAFEAGIELPAGQGRDLIVESCLGCHDLTAVPLFAPFYTRDSWRALLVTMQAHGADVDNAEIDALADYLVQNFGTN